jgi:hypothetical protein
MTQPFKVNGKRGDVKHNVKLLLEWDSRLRDDLLRTTCNYWYKIDGPKHKINFDELSAKQFFSLYSKGTFEHQASIARQWQKVQEENPNLRGDTWVKRQKHTRAVKNDLGYGTK